MIKSGNAGKNILRKETEINHNQLGTYLFQ